MQELARPRLVSGPVPEPLQLIDGLISIHMQDKRANELPGLTGLSSKIVAGEFGEVCWRVHEVTQTPRHDRKVAQLPQPSTIMCTFVLAYPPQS